MRPPALEFSHVLKRYGALRPLRLRSLAVQPGERVALQGFDAPAAELLVNLITGATLPDEGSIRVFGQSTADVPDEQAWLGWIDRFGIVSPRAVLLEGLSVAQNLAMPFTLDLDRLPEDIGRRVDALADAAGIPKASLPGRLADAPADLKARVHLARAAAVDPQILLLEHPTALVADPDPSAFAAAVARLADSRSLTVLVLTEDTAFAARVAGRIQKLHAATGELRPVGRWRRWL